MRSRDAYSGLSRHAVALACVLLVVFCLTSSAAATCVEADAPYQQIVKRWSDRLDDKMSSDRGYITVPLVIHIMEADAGRTVQTLWTDEAIARHFGVDSADGANDIWKEAAIRFAVTGIRVCRYAAPPPLTTDAGEIRVEMNKKDFEREFDRFVSGVSQQRAVNIHLWRLFAGIDGFGRSITSGKGKAFVWLDGKCVTLTTMRPDNCQRKLAHELGHALGLNHLCLARMDPVPTGPEVSACSLPILTCGVTGDETGGKLMRGTSHGRILCDKEKDDARQGAQLLLNPPQ